MVQNSQRGGASIITVAFLSLFILIMTVSMSKLMVGELHHAIDLENNIKAYYQAESGVEESILSLRQVMTNNPGSLFTAPNQNCDQDNVPTNFGAGGTGFGINDNITCRRVRTASNLVESTLTINETAHFDLTKKNFERIEIEWDTIGLKENDPALLFTSLQQGGVAPPFLEMTRIEYDDVDPGPTTLINPAGVVLKSLYLSPTTSGSDCSATINFSTCRNPDGGKVRVVCSTQPVYRCKATITNFMPPIVSTKRTVLRIRPYFNSTQYSMKIFDSLNQRVDVVLDKAVIDVTAKIGGSYRRIQQEINLVSQPLDGVEAVFGDNRICKKFVILDVGVGQFVDNPNIPNDCRLND